MQRSGQSSKSMRNSHGLPGPNDLPMLGSPQISACLQEGNWFLHVFAKTSESLGDPIHLLWGQPWDSMKPLLSSTRDFGELVPAGDG